MECDVFPCMICDNLDGLVCTADVLRRNVNDIGRCPMSAIPSGKPDLNECPVSPIPPSKPDLGKWVVEQPDGLFCYYDEDAGKIVAKGMTLKEIILYREKNCPMSHDFAELDTLKQVEFKPVRWENIAKNE